jgi:Protein of unknown function (DUF4239)
LLQDCPVFYYHPLKDLLSDGISDIKKPPNPERSQKDALDIIYEIRTRFKHGLLSGYFITYNIFKKTIATGRSIMLSEIFDLISIDRYEFGIPIVFLFSASCGFSYYIISKNFTITKLDPEIIGGFFQVIGTVYAILIGLVVYDATSRYSDAHETVEHESKSIIQVYTLAKHIKSGGAGDRIANKIKEYNDEVVLNDWDMLQDGKINIKARAILREVNDEVLSISPSTNNEEAILPILIQASIDVWTYRMSRFDSTGYALPTSEWVILVSGALLTIITPFFYQLESRVFQSILISMTSMIICSSLYAVLMFSEPYRGDFVVPKEPFIMSQKIINGIYFFGGKHLPIDTKVRN